LLGTDYTTDKNLLCIVRHAHLFIVTSDMLLGMKFLFSLSFALCAGGALAADIHFTSGLALPIRSNPRTLLRIDPVEHQIVTGKLDLSKWHKVQSPVGTKFTGPAFNSGYAYFEVFSESEKIMLLEATGHSMVYVNEVPRVGDIYSFGYVSLPVKLNKGKNSFLFATGRGGFQGKLIDPPSPISLDLRDTTSPDIIKGEKDDLYAAIIVRNATSQDQVNLSIDANGMRTKLPLVLSAGIRKVTFRVKPNGDGKYKLILKGGSKVLDQKEFSLRVREAIQTHKRTFTSEIDGSLQYYAVTPSRNVGPNQALFLSLHGASVEALGQAESFGQKSWGHVVCATNRRPFGFDWEDVGRDDALEVLEHAKAKYQTDPAKTYLTGHSMGGHGTWQLGSLYPDKFAAIAPCAGWISFNTYAGGATYPDTPIGNVFRKAGSTSNTLLMKPNLLANPIFILHGDADDNVPVQQARTMREELKEHKALQWHEEKGQGHWYDTDPEPGANVQDHAPIYDMFAKVRIPAMNEVRHIDFVTVNPAVSGKCHWVTVVEQENRGEVSRVVADSYPGLNKVVLRTENVKALRIESTAITTGKEIAVDWNGTTQNLQTIQNDRLGKIHTSNIELTYEDKKIVENPTVFAMPGLKQVFSNRIAFLYDDLGASSEEVTWAKNKAKYDAEQYWYRGNATVDVMSLSDFVKSPWRHKRNAIIYTGHGLFPDDPRQLNEKFLSVLRETVEKEITNVSRPSSSRQICFLANYSERTWNGQNQIVVIGGNSVSAARLAERLPLFTAGVAFPDFLMIEPTMLEKGIEGVIAAGYGDMAIRP
jgi:dienelactone hydrolase